MEPLPKELLELEHQLRLFVPQTPHITREQLLYQAGWEAALVQQAGNATATPRTDQAPPRRAANHYWAAACATLFLLSTALAWRVWQQPQSGAPTMITTAPATPPVSLPRASAIVTMQAPAIEERQPRSWENSATAWANYLELRERVTRGGLSMWPVSTPAPAEHSDTSPAPARDWQEELFRETL